MSENPEIITHEGRRFVRTGELGPVNTGDWFLSWPGTSIHHAKEFSPHPYEHLRELPAEPHTPLPWHYQENADVYTHVVRGPSGQFILSFAQDSSGQSESDARLTVEAVNSNADLLRLLGEAEKALISVKDKALLAIPAAIGFTAGDLQEIADVARAVLSQIASSPTRRKV